MIDRMIYECQRVSEIRRRMINPRPKMRTTNFLRKSPSFGNVIPSFFRKKISMYLLLVRVSLPLIFLITSIPFRVFEREKERERKRDKERLELLKIKTLDTNF